MGQPLPLDIFFDFRQSLVVKLRRIEIVLVTTRQAPNKKPNIGWDIES